MLDLQTPLVIGGKTYGVLVAGIRGEWNLQNRQITVYVGPARKRGNNIVIGTRETEDGKISRVLFPQMLRTFTIEDSNPSDPALSDVFQKLQNLVEAIEAVIVNEPELQEQVYQSGEDEFSLASTFQEYSRDAFAFDERTKVKGEKTPRE